MLNQVAVEALHSTNYVGNYLDSVENLPDDVQRHMSRIREIDVSYRGKFNENPSTHESAKFVLTLILPTLQDISVTSTTTTTSGRTAQPTIWNQRTPPNELAPWHVYNKASLLPKN